MLRELEQRLVTVLGADLPAPLSGRVTIRPDAASGNQPALQIAVRNVRPVSPDFGAIRLEIAPGAAGPRRIVRLEAEIDLRLAGAGGNSRALRVQALDDLLYFLDAPAIRSGMALRDTGDPGFLLESLTVARANYEPALHDPVPADLTLTAVGWFWPVGAVGQDGPAIAEARIAQLVYPVMGNPDPARFVAGAAETDIEITFTAQQMLSLRANGPGTIEPARIALQLLAADGGVGAGSLTNGQVLPDGIRSRPVIDGVVTLRYQPPGAPATDRLILRRVVEGAADHFGPVLLELPLITGGLA